MSYNHDAETLDEAIGQSVKDIIKKAEKLALSLPPQHLAVTSRQIEFLEKNFTTKELAILLAVTNTEKRPSKVNVVSVGKEELPKEVMDAFIEQIEKEGIPESGVFTVKVPFKDTDEECNCVACQLERKINKIPSMPLSKGGNA